MLGFQIPVPLIFAGRVGPARGREFEGSRRLIRVNPALSMQDLSMCPDLSPFGLRKVLFRFFQSLLLMSFVLFGFLCIVGFSELI